MRREIELAAGDICGDATGLRVRPVPTDDETLVASLDLEYSY